MQYIMGQKLDNGQWEFKGNCVPREKNNNDRIFMLINHIDLGNEHVEINLSWKKGIKIKLIMEGTKTNDGKILNHSCSIILNFRM